MKILWILPYAPTLIRTRPHYLLRALLARGHELTLAAVWENEAECQALAQFKSRGFRLVGEHLSKTQALGNIAGAILKRVPMQSRYSWCPALAHKIAALLRTEEFAAVHVEHLRGAAYGLLARQVLAPRRQAERVVWDSVDCISLLFEQAARNSRGFFGRWVTRLELPRTRTSERQLVRSFYATLVTSANDKSCLERLAGEVLPRVSVLPNGVDTAYFYPTDEPKSPAEVVFSGKLSYHANITAALHLVKKVMPYVWAARPEARLVLAGKDPARELVRLGQADARVIVTGTVDDLRPFLRRATVAAALVPYGVGIQNKVLEAMACGTAVVGSPQAAAALQVTPGTEMLVVKGAQAQAMALLQVMNDDLIRTNLSAAGRDYVIKKHGWQQIVGKLEAIYQDGYEHNVAK
jgi:glycosyltransferase involved in cell wall biosynthesis